MRAVFSATPVYSWEVRTRSSARVIVVVIEPPRIALASFDVKFMCSALQFVPQDFGAYGGRSLRHGCGVTGTGGGSEAVPEEGAGTVGGGSPGSGRCWRGGSGGGVGIPLTS